MMIGTGKIKQYGGSLILAISPEIRSELKLEPNDDVRFSLEKVSKEEKDELEIRRLYPEVAIGELHFVGGEKPIPIARFNKIFYKEDKPWEGFRSGPQNETEASIITGILFKGSFLTSGFVKLASLFPHAPIFPQEVLKMIDGSGVLILKTRDKELRVTNPIIRFDTTDPTKTQKIYNISFYGF